MDWYLFLVERILPGMYLSSPSLLSAFKMSLVSESSDCALPAVMKYTPIKHITHLQNKNHVNNFPTLRLYLS